MNFIDSKMHGTTIKKKLQDSCFGMEQCLCLRVTPQVIGWPLQHDSDYVCTSCMPQTDDGPCRDAHEMPCCISDISTATDGGCRFAGGHAYWIWQIRMYNVT